MTARIAVLALATALAVPACAVQLTTALDLGPPTVRLEAGETLYATRSAEIALPPGETVLRLPLDELGVDPADVVVEVEPAVFVALIGARTTGDDEEGATTLWRLRAERAVDATVSLTYPMKGLTRAVGYAATLAPDGSVDLQASLRVTNELGRDLEDAKLVGDEVRATLSLADGQSITVDQPWLSGTVPADAVQRQIVYDRARHGDAAVELLTIDPLPARPDEMTEAAAPARLSGPLAAGKVRIYAATDAGPEFIGESSVAYTPAGESIQLRLGPASGVLVKRTLDESKEVDRRLDARNTVVLFDLLETWILEVRNLRESPVTLEIRQKHDGYWKVERSTHDYDRPDAETLVFEVEIDAGKRAEITYRVRHLNREP